MNGIKYTKHQLDFLENGGITKKRIQTAEQLLIDQGYFVVDSVEKAKKFFINQGYIIVDSLDDAKQILMDNGYKVSNPLMVNEKISNIKELLKYFYKRLRDKYPESQFEYLLDTWIKDMRMIRHFVHSREKTGLSRRSAIQECVAIIDIIFDCEKEFSFKSPININFLGQGKFSWVTEKSVDILNNKLVKQKESKVEEFREEVEENLGVNLDERSKELTTILKKMGGNN